MLQVFSRAIFRENHETLDNSNPVKSLEIVNMFIGMLERTEFNTKFREKYEIDAFLRVPMTDESI
jgi:hypothetical protein